MTDVWGIYTDARNAAKLQPVKLAEMVDTVDALAQELAGSQRALLHAGLRAAPHPDKMRQIVTIETVLELLGALVDDAELAKQISRGMAARRKVAA